MASLVKRFKYIDRKTYSLSTKNGSICYALLRSPHRRSVGISVGNNMEVNVVAPVYVSEPEVRSFILKHLDWIDKRISEARRTKTILQSKQYTDGDHFLFLGRKYALKVIEKDIKRPCIHFDGLGWKITIPSISSATKRCSLIKNSLIQWYHLQAMEIFGGRVFHFARILALEPMKILIRNQKRIWGSCGYHSKTISLNWQLVMAPMEVIDYVIVHELCHLIKPNHSRRYWKVVAQVLPTYKRCQQWLKANRIEMILP